jgi:hypothetical protein
MNRLPIEILVDIFSLLVFKDKLECALTCRDWYAKISSTVLYSKIGFKYTQSDARTKSKIKLLHKRGFGHQILDICIKEIDDPLELAKLCPNLKSLQVNDWFSDDWDDSNNESLARNWGKLETINEARSHNILDPRPRYYLSLKLLDAPLYMMCLTSLTMNLREREDVLPMLTEQLLYAPMLDKLCLEKVPNLDHKRLDLLHKNVLNLKHLELRKINSRFVEDYDFSEDYEFLSMDYSFIVQNLRSISITFSNRYNPELRSHHVEMMVMYWIEYMYHKYTNLSSIAMPDANRTPQQHHRDIMQSYLQRAFCNWSQLEKFDVQPIYFSNKLLQTMDDCNICLKELTVYVDQEEDMDQFINLAYSKQGNNLKS